jgi:hypothetical protein
MGQAVITSIASGGPRVADGPGHFGAASFGKDLLEPGRTSTLADLHVRNKQAPKVPAYEPVSRSNLHG